MPNSMRSSARCANFRPAEGGNASIDWWPSRWLSSALFLLGLLAGVSLLLSDLPEGVAWPGALLAPGYGWWAARRVRRSPARSFVFRGEAVPLVDGVAADGFVLQWRGPLAFARWRDARGRWVHCAWWPDTLPAPRRRELRLAAPGGRDAGRTGSMAP